jgi:hypothetical protein
MQLRATSEWHFAAAATLAIASGTAMLTGCTPQIGDSCSLSTDCASDGTRVCDTAEPGGYCTVLNCTGNNLGSVCPDNAYCINFNPNVPGCPYNPRVVSRASEAECRNGCGNNGDCRAGYICANPMDPPWSAQILDPDQTAMVCLPMLSFTETGISTVNYGYDGSLDAVPPVCQAAGPSFDAGFPPLDAAVDGAADSGADAGHPDSGKRDGGGHDATLGTHDASEGGHRTGDAIADAAHEAG